jgi:xylulose-5-phosphate/fructose-6-phosphate phosphoketolase
MVVLNDLDRFHLVMDAADRVPALAARASHLKQLMREKRAAHKEYIVRHGEDMPEVREWKWMDAQRSRPSAETTP